MKYELVPVETLRALEKVFPNHLKNLKKMIYSDGGINQPLIVEKDHNIVLDGSHRHVFFAIEGFRYAPVHYVDYNDENIRVGTDLKHRFFVDDNCWLTKREVIKRGVSGDLFPPRTTRHFFPFRKFSELNISLSDLGKRKPIDMSGHFEDVDISIEIAHNKKYIREIEEEISEIILYLSEVRETKMYLHKQIKEME